MLSDLGGVSDNNLTHNYVYVQCDSTSTMLTYRDGVSNVCVTPIYVTHVSVTRLYATHISHKCTTYAYVQCDSTSAIGLSWRCVRAMCNTYLGVSDIYLTYARHVCSDTYVYKQGDIISKMLAYLWWCVKHLCNTQLCYTCQQHM